jgi:hypothetical protein
MVLEPVVVGVLVFVVTANTGIVPTAARVEIQTPTEATGEQQTTTLLRLPELMEVQGKVVVAAAVRHLVFRGLETLVVKVATTVVVVVDHQVTIVLKKPVALVDREKPECVGYEHISTSKEKVGNGKLTV